MPWNEVSLMSQRAKLIEKLLMPNANITTICKEHNISRKTAYKWLSRYEAGCLDSLKDLSRTPKVQPNKSSLLLEAKVIELHAKYPTWGPRKLRHLLISTIGDEATPSATTISRILKRNGCEITKNIKSRPARTRFERDRPNELWQIDFKGSYLTEQERCFPLTILDDHSRYSLGIKACKDETRQSVQGYLEEVFIDFGMPEQINFDNGNPWGNSRNDGPSKIAIWLIKHGVRVSYSAPYHPQTNGKDERFHRTLKLEVLHKHQYRSCSHMQHVFDQWRQVYNQIRPHDALNGGTPSSRYCQSSRVFSSKPCLPEYFSDDYVRKVHAQLGSIMFNGRRYRVGKGLAGEYIALRETEDEHTYSVFFCDTYIKSINIKEEMG